MVSHGIISLILKHSNTKLYLREIIVDQNLRGGERLLHTHSRSATGGGMGVHKGRKTIIAPSGLKGQRLRVAGHSGKLLPFTPRNSLWKQHSAARRQRLPIWLLL